MARPAKSARSTLGLKTNARVSLAVNASNSRRRVQERIKSSDGKIPRLTSEGREERNRLAPSWEEPNYSRLGTKGSGRRGRPADTALRRLETRALHRLRNESGH